MTPSELHPIVAAWGGPQKFAAMLGVGNRIVYYWLAGKRGIKPPVARLIRSLEPPKREGGECAALVQHPQSFDESGQSLVAGSPKPQ